MVDFDALMQPIKPDNRSGNDLRLDSSNNTFAKLNEMSQEIDSAIDPSGNAKSADWSGVVTLAGEVLCTKSKDLELATILTQGLVVKEGFPGLITGLRLINGLISEFWETVHPGWDQGQVIEAIRARPLSWLGSSKAFLLAVKRVPLSAPIGTASYSWFDYEQSQRVDQAAVKADQGHYQELLASGFISGEQWRGSLGGTPPDRMELVLSGLSDCLNELQALNKTCEEFFQDDPPFLLDLRNLLEEIQQYLEKFQTSSSGASPPVTIESPTNLSTEHQANSVTMRASGSPIATGGQGAISSRDEAYRRLREVAEYLRRTEPHSPVPPLLDRAVRWGNMTFEKLFEDVVKNKEAQVQTRDLLGLDPEKSIPKPTNSPSSKPAAGQKAKRMNG